MLFALFVEPTFAVPSTSAAPPACAHCAAPGPIAGAGLPILAIGGGGLLAREVVAAQAD